MGATNTVVAKQNCSACALQSAMDLKVEPRDKVSENRFLDLNSLLIHGVEHANKHKAD